ncbi:MAG: zinc-binding dehydrogenase [Solirubrobacteraceae bacterium]
MSIRSPGAPEALELVEAPEPAPETGEVTIDVAYAGVGFVDTLFRRGALPLPMPLTPGIEVSGHVRSVGAEVEGLEPGQPVAALLNDFVNLPGAGGYAEVARARAALTIPLDVGADLADAASVLVNGTTAWMALKELAHVERGEDVLVLGATGGLGGLLGQLARKADAGRVIAAVGTASKREAAERAGYTDVLVTDALAEGLKRVTGGRGVDAAFDPVGGDARRVAFEGLAPLGRLVALGNASGSDVSFAGDQIWLGSRAVIGLSVGGIAHLVPERVAAAAREVLGWTARRELDVAPAAVLALRDAAKAHRMLEGREITGKLVLGVSS